MRRNDDAAIPVLEAIIAAVLMLSVVLLASRLPNRDPAAAPASSLGATADGLAISVAAMEVGGVGATSWDPAEEGWLDALMRGDSVTAAAAQDNIEALLPPDLGYTLRLSNGEGTLDLLPWGRMAAPPEGSTTGSATVYPNWTGLGTVFTPLQDYLPGDPLDSSAWTCLKAPSQQEPSTLGLAANGLGPSGMDWIDIWHADDAAHVPAHVPFGGYAAYTGTVSDPATCAGGTLVQQLRVLPPGDPGTSDDLWPYTLDLVVWRRG